MNLGTLGYLAEVDQDHLETALDHLVLGEYHRGTYDASWCSLSWGPGDPVRCSPE